ncbi:NmrA/HSCARG family protein [Streptomyces sp. NPDC050636]|uniref:NmrA/HSCARG family protein n=1 Tax=Streptomyces sp. NPDC050636 TaxID=3154510 RepID=UPI00342EB2B7
MPAAHDTVLVFGATGRQGGAVARELLRRGRPVRALVRDPHSAAAKALREAGATLVPGDMTDPVSLDMAMREVRNVYSVQTFTGEDGLEGEVRQGIAVADAAARTKIAHFVYGSVGGAERASGVGHFETKGEIERHIDRLGLPATVLRPTMFMENFAHIGPRRTDDGLVLTLGLHAHTPLQMISTADIGHFAAEVFDRPERYLGLQLEIAGDELTPLQMAETFQRVGGVSTRFQEQSDAELKAISGELATMFGWFREHGYRADLPVLRREHPGLTSLENWLRTTGWSAPTA